MKPPDPSMTLDDPSSTAEARDATTLGLTLLWHPDLRRVGERAPLGPGPLSLNRTEPDFRDTHDTPTGPLADPYVSRTPITLTPARGGVTVTGALTLDGHPLDGSRWLDPATLDRGVTLALGRRVLLRLHPIPRRPCPAPTHDLIGDSLAIRRLRTDITRLAHSQATVLIRGESGTGKELVARALHRAGPRAGGPYRAVNVAAVPPTLAAATFFGHLDGAFSGAKGARRGYFGDSDGGTLFLDEIGDLPPEVQPLLLRALESGEVQPVGASNTRRVDVRVIAATDARLEAAIERGAFSRALLHRLAGLELWLPPLRHRVDDIPRLLAWALRRELDALGALDRIADPAPRRPWLDARAIAPLLTHDWPGNVRELLNVARQLAALGHDRDRIRARDVPALARLDRPAPSTHSDAPTSIPPPAEPPDRAPPDDAAILDALRAAGWSVHRAARALGVPKTTLYRLVESAGLIRKATDIPDDELRAAYAQHDGDRAAMSDHLRISTRALALRLGQLDPPP